MGVYRIRERQVALPVEVRTAAAWSATFAVRAAAVREVVGYSGLAPAEPIPGRALCSLVCVDYVDGDLGPYHEFGVCFLVKAPRGKRGLGAFVHWLPVDGEFTCAAGRTIWGFPKEMADIAITRGGSGARCVVRAADSLAVDLRIRGGVPIPGVGAGLAVDAYTCLDGTLRRTQWTMRPQSVRTRPGGAALTLGDHPVAAQLRTLGLPRRPLFASAIGNLRMTFGPAALA